MRIKTVFFSFLGLLLCSAGIYLLLCYAILGSLKSLKLEKTQALCKVALPIGRALNLITFNRISELVLLEDAVVATDLGAEILTQLSSQLGDNFSLTNLNIGSILPKIDKLSLVIEDAKKQLSRSAIMPRLISQAQLEQLERALDRARDMGSASQFLLDGKKQVLLVFQNSDELRASGGFMGSYMKIQLVDGAVAGYQVEDIYDADGQFSGFFPAPPGVHEYLSNGRGLRLPDSNWDADFSVAGQTMLKYFALGGVVQVDLLVAVNLDLAKSILDLVKELDLPDYNLTVTKDNLSEALGSHRTSFFAGSIQKKQMLTHLISVLSIKLSSLPPESYKQVGGILGKAVLEKQVLFYSPHQNLQSLIQKHNLGGLLPTDPTNVLYFLESNVGINKANAKLSRAIELELVGQKLTAKIIFNNQENHELAYVNYQRALFPKDWQLQEVVFDQTQIKEIDLNTFDPISDDQTPGFLAEVGFLVVVPSKSTKTIIMEFILPTLPAASPDVQEIALIKQPGIPPTSLKLSINGKLQTILVDTDLLIAI